MDTDKLKEQITTEQVMQLVADFGGNPTPIGGGFSSDTICHNEPGRGSHKLYYYENTNLFHCYTGCSPESFDVFQLIIKLFEIQKDLHINLPESISYMCNRCGIAIDNEYNETEQLIDWKLLNAYDKLDNTYKTQDIVLPQFEDDILTKLPHPIITPWLREGITQEVLDSNNICYESAQNKIVIPHYDINNRLIGIRGRCMSKEDEAFGKYRPIVLNDIEYKHPLGFNLYGLNWAKEPISKLTKAIVYEGEKSVLLYQSYFGLDNSIAVAVCGSTFSAYQVKLLLELGVREIIIAFDKQFQTIGDEEWMRWTRKLNDINTHYCKYADISFLFDKWNLLDYKDSPIDKGKDTFLELYKRRIFL